MDVIGGKGLGWLVRANIGQFTRTTSTLSRYSLWVEHSDWVSVSAALSAIKAAGLRGLRPAATGRETSLSCLAGAQRAAPSKKVTALFTK